jgi:hypothetical protein
MRRIAATGRRQRTIRGFAAGLDGILFQTAFYGPDRGADWAFVFSAGSVVVLVHTEEATSSLNAELLAVAVASTF